MNQLCSNCTADQPFGFAKQIVQFLFYLYTKILSFKHSSGTVQASLSDEVGTSEDQLSCVAALLLMNQYQMKSPQLTARKHDFNVYKTIISNH